MGPKKSPLGGATEGARRLLGLGVSLGFGLSSLLLGGTLGCFLGLVGEAGAEGGSFLGAGLEAVNATFGVNNLLFAGEEGVRGGGDLDLDQGVQGDNLAVVKLFYS